MKWKSIKMNVNGTVTEESKKETWAKGTLGPLLGFEEGRRDESGFYQHSNQWPDFLSSWKGKEGDKCLWGVHKQILEEEPYLKASMLK